MTLKILFLTAHLPFPYFSGGRRREYELVTRLGSRHEIFLCSVTRTLEIDSVHIDDMIQHCPHVKLFECTPVHNEISASYPDQMIYHMSQEAGSYISFILGNKFIDLIHVEGYFLMQFLPEKMDIPVLLVEQNIEYTLNKQRLILATTPEEKIYHWRQYLYTLKWERYFWKKATKCVTLSPDDMGMIRRLEPNVSTATIPNGSNHDLLENGIYKNGIYKNGIYKFHKRQVPKRDHTLLFVGNFAYEPNVDAVIYLCQLIFPLILKYVPDAKLLLVGNAPPAQVYFFDIHPQIEVYGYVDSLVPFYETAEVVVCPLRMGGGVKVKVLEAVHVGKAIVTTSIGAQGLDLDRYKAVLVSDEKADFARKVVKLLIDSNERYHQEQEALAYAKTLSTWEQASEAFALTYEKLTCRNF